MLRLIRLSSRLAQPVRMRKSSTLTHKYQTMLEKDSDELVQRKLRFMNLSLEHTEQQHNIFIAKYNQRKPQLINSGIISGAVTVSAYIIHSGLGRHDHWRLERMWIYLRSHSLTIRTYRIQYIYAT